MEENLVATISADTRQFQASLRELIASVQRVGQDTAQAMARATAEQQRAAAAAKQAAKETQAFHAAQKRASEEAFKSSQAATQSLGSLTTSFRGVSQAAAAFGVTLTAVGLVNFTKSAIAASVQMTALQNSFKAITGSMTDANATMAFLRETANRLGVDLVSTAQGFQRMAASAKDTALEGAGVREIFLGIIESSRVMGRSQEETARALIAVGQMMSKGRVMAEELNQQLSEALPGSLGVFARALGKSTADLQKLVEAGRVGLPDLVKFGTQLRREAAGGMAAMATTFESASNRMGTAVNDLLVAFGDIVTKNPAVINAIEAIADEIAATAQSIQDHQKDYQAGFKAIYDGIAMIFTIGKQWQATFAAMETSVQNWQKSVINSLVETGKKIGLLLPTVQLPFMEIRAPGPVAGPAVEGPEARSPGLFDPSRSRETVLLPIKKTLEEIQQLQRDIQSHKDLLNNTDLHLSEIQVQAVRNELAGLEKKWQDLTTPVEQSTQALKRQAAELKALQREEHEFADETIRLMRERLDAQERVNEERLDDERRTMDAFRQIQQQGWADVAREAERALGPGVRALRDVTSDIAQSKAQLDEALDPTEARLLTQHLKNLEDMSDTLSKTLQESLVEKGLIPAGQAMGEFGDQIDGSMASVREFIDQQHELREIMALTPEAGREEMARYIAELKKAGVAAADIQRVQFDQAREELQKTREQIEDVQEATSDFLFDFASALTDSSKSVKDVWKDTLDSLQAMFLRTLTDMAAKALVSQITIPVSLGGDSTTGAGGMDLSGLLDLLSGLGGTGSTAVPGATVTGGAPAGGMAEFQSFDAGSGMGAPATGGISTSGAASAAGSGLAAGTFTSGLFTQAGWSGTGANVASGAIGGAVAGTMIAPGIGTAIGAAIGALIPALMNRRTRELITGHWPGVRHLAGFQSIKEGNIGEGLLQMMAMGLPGSVMELLDFLGNNEVSFQAAFRTMRQQRGGFFEGAARRGPFGFVGIPGALDVPEGTTGADFADLFLTIDEAIATHLTRQQKAIATAALQAQRQGITLNFKQFDNEIFDLTRDRMDTILKSLGREVGLPGGELAQLADQVFAGIQRDDKNLEQLEEAFAQATAFFDQMQSLTMEPLSQAEQALAGLNEQFDLLAEQAQQYGIGLRLIEQARKREVIQFFQDVVQNLKIQQEALLQSIAGTRQFVTEATETPAVIFRRRQEELEQLQDEFMTAGRARQVAMAPELLQRIQQLMQASMSEDVLGQDRDMVLRLRQDLLSFIDDIERLAGQKAFDSQIQKAQQQIDEMKALRTITDEQLTEANMTLRRIEQFLMKSQEPFVGTFQQGGIVPATGLAYVHKGETVLPPGETAINMSVTINASGGLSRQQAVEAATTIWEILENKARRREIPLRLESR